MDLNVFLNVPDSVGGTIFVTSVTSRAIGYYPDPESVQIGRSHNQDTRFAGEIQRMRLGIGKDTRDIRLSGWCGNQRTVGAQQYRQTDE